MVSVVMVMMIVDSSIMNFDSSVKLVLGLM